MAIRLEVFLVSTYPYKPMEFLSYFLSMLKIVKNFSKIVKTLVKFCNI